MKTRPSRSVFLRVGHRWHWRILSRWDDSELASGYALRWSECQRAARAARDQLRIQKIN